MPLPRGYPGPVTTSPASASDDLQASALRLMRLYGGPSAPAQPADARDYTAPESWAPMVAACAVPGPGSEPRPAAGADGGEPVPLTSVTRMPARTEVVEGAVPIGGHRLPA